MWCTHEGQDRSRVLGRPCGLPLRPSLAAPHGERPQLRDWAEGRPVPAAWLCEPPRTYPPTPSAVCRKNKKLHRGLRKNVHAVLMTALFFAPTANHTWRCANTAWSAACASARSRVWSASDTCCVSDRDRKGVPMDRAISQ
jgi:hypothetical protein